jgi:hypothetical protein
MHTSRLKTHFLTDAGPAYKMLCSTLGWLEFWSRVLNAITCCPMAEAAGVASSISQMLSISENFPGPQTRS